MRPILFSLGVLGLWLAGAATASADDTYSSGSTVVRVSETRTDYAPDIHRIYNYSGVGPNEYADLPYNLSSYCPNDYRHHRHHRHEYRYTKPCGQTVVCETYGPGYYYSPYVGQCDPYHNWFYSTSPYYRPAYWSATGYELGGW